MMLYKNTKVKVRSLDGDIDYFDIVAGVLQGDTLAPYLFIICLDYMLRTSNERKGFKLANERSRRYSTQMVMNVDYADDLALLANTSTLAKTLLHSHEWAAAGIDIHVYTDKTKYMCFNQRGNISILKGGPLKQVDKFTYWGSSVSTKKDINMWLAKAWTAIDRLLVLSYLPNPSARAVYDTRSIFKRSLTGLNSEFSFS